MVGWLGRLRRRIAQRAAPAPHTPASGTGAIAADAGKAYDRGVELYEASQFADACRCFESALDIDPEFAHAYYYLGMARGALGQFEDAADAFTMASYFSPVMSAAYLGLAEAQWKQGDARVALQSIGRALELDDRNPESHKLRAALLVEAGDVPAAIASYRQAIELRADDAAAHASLGYLLFNDCAQYELGASHLERALEIDPDNLFALCNHTLVLLAHRAQPEAAVRVADRLLARHPELHEARLNRALALLTLGRFDLAWDDYEARKLVRGNYRPKAVALPEWQGDDLAGKTALIHAEQGLGDEVMFASCFGDVIARAKHCSIACSSRLQPLFARSFPAARVVNDQAFDSCSAAELAERFDCRIAAGSIPRYFRRSWSDFPRHAGYLRPDAGCQDAWRQRLAALGPGLRVGLSWRGGAVSTRRSLRSVPLRDLAPLLAVANCHFVDLQYGDTAQERSEARLIAACELHHWQDAIDDLDQCAALIANLDLVISVCTALIHLSGAIGRPVWVMVPRNPEWRYLAAGERMPWYPSATLVRQQTSGDWGAVIAQLAIRLNTTAADKGGNRR